MKAGGRTGMTSLVIGVLFLACLFFSPLATSLQEIDGAALLYVAICSLETSLILSGMIANWASGGGYDNYTINL